MRATSVRGYVESLGGRPVSTSIFLATHPLQTYLNRASQAEKAVFELSDASDVGIAQRVNECEQKSFFVEHEICHGRSRQTCPGVVCQDASRLHAANLGPSDTTSVMWMLRARCLKAVAGVWRRLAWYFKDPKLMLLNATDVTGRHRARAPDDHARLLEKVQLQ